MSVPDLTVLVSVLVPAIGGLLYLILKSGLEQSISNRFETLRQREIERLRAEYSRELERLRHQFQMDQVRTSLFFQHQREAFTSVVSGLVATRTAFDESYDQELQDYGSLPGDAYTSLKKTYVENLLFLDEECCAAVELCLRTMMEARPWMEGDGTVHEPSTRFTRRARDQFDFLVDAIAELFRSKLGLSTSSTPFRRIAILAGVLVLNGYHFPAIGLPTEGCFKRDSFRSVEALIATGEQNLAELILELEKLDAFVSSDTHGGYWARLLPELRVYLAELRRAEGNT